MPVRARLADVILGIAETCGFNTDSPDMVAVKVPKRDLSNMAVTAYETALRTISDLEEKNLIRYEGKNLHILDQDGLERASRNEDE
jgi:CRP-like cAMP-binding protein